MQRALWRYDGIGDPVPCEIVERDDRAHRGVTPWWVVRFGPGPDGYARTDELELVLREHCNMTHSTKGRGSD